MMRDDRLTSLAYRGRVYILLLLIVGVMAAIAPNFVTVGNFANILKAAGINLLAGIGFTIVMISGQLEPQLGWVGSFFVAILCGVVLGLVNGLLVARAKVSSFIVTLGTMIIVQNAVFLYGKGGTIPASSFALSDWFQRPIAAGITFQIILPLVVMGIFAAFLRWTPAGRGFYLVGGNQQTAWYAGLSVQRYLIGAFVLSAFLASFGGALIAMSEAGANPTMGDSSLMTIVAAVIIGGTSMRGGRGTLTGTTVALVALAALINGLSCRGEGFEVQLMASGFVLASIILYDAYTEHRREVRRGQRLNLLKELSPGHPGTKGVVV
jgi:ribose/xylose/arabinose/galactoside ABC-type transport system permease subunit